MHLFHRWELRDAAKMLTVKFGSTKHTTELLYVCPCGKAKTASVDGHWELNSLKATPKEVIEDLIRSV